MYTNYRIFHEIKGDISHKYNLEKLELQPNKTIKEMINNYWKNHSSEDKKIIFPNDNEN